MSDAPVPRLRFLPVLLLALAPSFLPAAPFTPSPPIKGEHGMVLTEFAKEPFLKNPVALTVDDRGRVFVTSVVRRKAADLDIRDFREWIPTDLSLRSVEDKRAFYRRELTAAQGDRYKRIGDQNKDGRYDWRDLTVLSDRIIRLEDHDLDGVADKATTFAEGFNSDLTGIAAGVAAWDNRLYATVEPDAWAFEDPDDDGVSDTRRSLAHGFSVHIAYAGHNFSGPRIGPDGRLYFSSTDKGMNVTSREGINFAHPHSGTIVRCELDGSHFEVFATGLRNVQEPAFDQFGNLFGVDNDGDMRGEKERFVYIVEGSDTGWRCNWQYRGGDYQPWLAEGLYVPTHPKQAAYIVPCISTYHDGPTGFAFNPGTALNDFYRDHFFMTAFPSRRLYAFQVKQAGASFEMAGEHLVASGVLMTGINFGPDGALYVADWSAQGYELNEKGGVWKMDDPAAADSNLRERTAGLLREDWLKQPSATFAEHLEHPDQRVRMKAQFELARRKDAATLATVAASPAKPLLARLHAIWGLGQVHRRATTLAHDPLTPFLSDSDPEVRAQAAKVLAEIPALRDHSRDGLLALLAAPDHRPRFFAAIALGRFQVRSATSALVDYLTRDGADPYHRHAGMMGLLGCAPPAHLAALATHQSKSVRLAAVVALRRLRAPEVTSFLADSDPLVVAEAARAIHDDESIPAALPALAQLLESTAPREEATIRRALSAAIRLRTPKFAALVANYAADSTAPAALRLRALDLLAHWSQPNPLDTVEGVFRPLPRIALHEIRPAIHAQLDSLVKSPDKPLADHARRTAAVYGIGTDPAQLLAAVKADREEAADALRLLASQDQPSYAEAAALAINSQHPSVRAAALEAISVLTPPQLPAAATKALASTDLAEARTALALLGASTEPASAEVLTAAVAKLQGATLDPALALDVLEAAEASTLPPVTAALASYLAARDPADPLAPFQETLHGGDPARGMDLFNTHVAAQCVRCHQVEGEGSTVGPALGTIGTKEPRYLLQSLLDPGAVVAPGFGVTSVTLKDGESLTANLAGEDENQVQLLLPDGTTRAVPAASIASRTPPVSSMPPMGLVLQKRELRDLLAYLQSLRQPENPPPR